MTLYSKPVSGPQVSEWLLDRIQAPSNALHVVISAICAFCHCTHSAHAVNRAHNTQSAKAVWISISVSKCVCSNQTVETWQKPWINSVKTHSLAVPVLQNPSSFLIAQIGPHFIRIPSALDLFHWKAKEQESIASTLSFSLCQNIFMAHHRITDLAIRRKTGKNMEKPSALRDLRELKKPNDNWSPPHEIHILHSLFSPLPHPLDFKHSRYPTPTIAGGFTTVFHAFFGRWNSKTLRTHNVAWRKLKEGKGKQTKTNHKHRQQCGSSQLRTKALQGDQN